MIGLALLSSHEQFIIPSYRAVAAVDANIAGRRQTLLLLALPFDFGRTTLLVVEVSGE